MDKIAVGPDAADAIDITARWRRTRRTCVSHLRIAALPNRRRHSSGIGRVERTSHSEGPDDDLAAKPRDLSGMHLRIHPQGDSRRPSHAPYTRHVSGRYG